MQEQAGELEDPDLKRAPARSAFDVDMGPSTPQSAASEQQQHLLDKEPPPCHQGRLARFQAVLEEGHAAAGITLATALTLGLILGCTLPTDKEIPGA